MDTSIGQKWSTEQTVELALKCRDAYACGYYTWPSWIACARLLCSRGYSNMEVEAVLRSNWMSRAAETAPGWSKANSSDFACFLDNPRNKCTRAEVLKLTAKLFKVSI